MKRIIVVISGIIVVSLFIGVITHEMLAAKGVIADGRLMGFDVDSHGRLYLGRHAGRIEIYSDNELTGVIRLPNSPHFRKYRFFIEGDQITVSTTGSSTIYVFDLQGELLSTHDDQLQKNEREKFGKKEILRGGEKYTLRSYAGLRPYEIWKNDIIIYRMTRIDYCFNGLPATLTVMVLLFIMILCVFFFIAEVVNAWSKQ